ncbi:host attachment family protein [Mangrovibrevibacter kandeliae]|uniref:host attachment family protein n=1 Tax=Mangrovibrevibacter kandeliae TaxID=2968473 RepID=UPI0021198B19|nr:host attachment protein [Aurantimonas sp. CSK15Z-1]MCQ8781160.1 host attachment protein [Aurantimonas sp. CSK15Z-1]
MQIPNGATIAVADGAKLSLFRNSGNEGHPRLTELPVHSIDTHNKSGGVGHSSSAANPDDRQVDEDAFAAGAAELLNSQAMTGKIGDVIIIAAPRTLGELRKHYHTKLKQGLLAEIAKDLTGQSSDDILKAIAAA